VTRDNAPPGERNPDADGHPNVRLPAAGSVLRRALLVWGAGHLALGDRRGWLLLLLQPIAIAMLAGLAVLLLDSSRWIAVFPALVLLLGIWLGQAMHAQRAAIALGARPGGEFQVALLLPLVIALLSGFWMVGGARASPSATLQHYVAAWQAERPDAAVQLFARPVSASALASDWSAQRTRVERLVRDAAARYGSLSGLNPDQPFNSLRFEEITVTAESVNIAVDVVRRRRVEAELFGLIPTATQETVRVERLGTILLRAHPAPSPAWLPLDPPGVIWLIEDVRLPSP
jgi:hypothetical protein